MITFKPIDVNQTLFRFDGETRTTLPTTSSADVRRYLAQLQNENQEKAGKLLNHLSVDDMEWLRNGLIRRPIF